jgi:hypothetical protein
MPYEEGLREVGLKLQTTCGQAKRITSYTEQLLFLFKGYHARLRRLCSALGKGTKHHQHPTRMNTNPSGTDHTVTINVKFTHVAQASSPVIAVKLQTRPSAADCVTSLNGSLYDFRLSFISHARKSQKKGQPIGVSLTRAINAAKMKSNSSATLASSLFIAGLRIGHFLRSYFLTKSTFGGMVANDSAGY